MNINNIFLVGFMASGKSSFGKKLAKELKYSFIDFDVMIAEKEKLSINDIFKQKGEKHFRALETQLIKTLKTDQCVIALGGGTPCYNKNMEIILSKGLIVYLELPIKILIGRLKQDKEQRPLVKNLNEKDITETVTKLFKQREKYYQKAHLQINALHSDAKMKKEIIAFLEK